jgi:phenylacetate-CoA ligase
MLEESLDAVPAYSRWRRLDPGPSRSVSERYRSLPTITKRDLRAFFPDGFVPRGEDIGKALTDGEVSYVQTSGTTDDRVTLLWSQSWWDKSERQSWLLNSLASRVATGTHREVVMASPLCVGPPPCRRALSVSERTIGRLLFVNNSVGTDVWRARDIRRMASEMDSYAPVVIEADPPYLAAFARAAWLMGIRVQCPRMVVLTYSYPSLAHLRWIGRLFPVPTVSSYGSTEAGYVFMQCERGMFHQNTRGCRVDVLPWKNRFGGPMVGSIVVTPFGRRWFSVLRFHVGDIIRLSPEPCGCGRSDGLTAVSIEGRGRDVTFTGEGLPVTVGMLDAAVGSIEGILTYRLNQSASGHCVLRVVLDGTVDRRGVREQAISALKTTYGRVESPKVIFVSRIVPEPSGKYRLARSFVPRSADSLIAPGHAATGA